MHSIHLNWCVKAYLTGMSNGVEAAISSGMYVVYAIDKRADNLAIEKVVSEAASVDRHELIKNAYFKRRNSASTPYKCFSSYISVSRLCGTYISTSMF
ncbi:hypothetical protein [Methyloglobulus sp.]|uniref:hypothetical protein n=1 Tax=Methyloglobulus sp. TaxID=2518622 RepID=UPI0032B7A864